MRLALWPHHSAADLRPEMPAMLGDPDGLVLVALADDGRLLGMAEASIRRDYVNGCETSPVGFLEAIYVVDEARRQGVARALVDAVASWTRDKGLTELASDADLGNTISHAMHDALGFEESQRVVFFRKPLTR